MVPCFYGIPKIHKEPVKLRPIIPCHSAVQNPAAKYVSKGLKPIIKSAPTILHGTKDLAIKLSKLKLTDQKYFIVTSDVVAFYPSIPMENCIDITLAYFEWFYYRNTDKNDHDRLMDTLIFIKALRVGNTKLIFIHDNQLYEQKRGLAMGVADSPNLANFYGWHFAQKLQIHKHPLIPFYGRYIDDICAIVYASTREEALAIMSQVKFDECVIEWNASDQFQVFLDMTLYIDENRRLQYMPYRKARSHQERIPWISHHPLDVKRGTYYGEMSRLATISSTYSIYSDAIRGLAALYIARGYPEDIVLYWTKNNMQEKWEKHLNETPQQHKAVLDLKSEFNTTWNYFSASELGSTILDFWRDWMQHAEAGQYNLLYPEFTSDRADLEDTAAGLVSRI